MATEELRMLFSQIIARAPLGTNAKTYLRSGLYVQVNNAQYSRVNGRIYPDAINIHRKRKLIVVNGYIKLYVFTHTTMSDVARTFAHELSHFKDWYNSVSIFPQGYIETSKIPWGREKRARAFAAKVMTKCANKSQY